MDVDRPVGRAGKKPSGLMMAELHGHNVVLVSILQRGDGFAGLPGVVDVNRGVWLTLLAAHNEVAAIVSTAQAQRSVVRWNGCQDSRSCLASIIMEYDTIGLAAEYSVIALRCDGKVDQRSRLELLRGLRLYCCGRQSEGFNNGCMGN